MDKEHIHKNTLTGGIFFSKRLVLCFLFIYLFFFGTGDVLMIPPLDFLWPVSWKHLSTFIQEELSIVT